MLRSGLNFGSHFPGLSGKSCKGVGILTTPGVAHGLAIIVTTIGGVVETGGVWIEVVGIYYVEIDDDWADDDWGDDVETIVLCWVGISETGIWILDVELISLTDSDWVFLVLTLLCKGNSFGEIPIFSLWSLVRGFEETNFEVTLPSDISDSSRDNENPFNLWIKSWTSGDSRFWLSECFEILVVGVWIFFAISSIGFCISEEIEKVDEGVLLSEWLVDKYLLAIHSSCPPSSTKNVEA